MMSVAIPLNKITNGVVTLNVFRTAVPQVVVSGKSYLEIHQRSRDNDPGNGWTSARVQFRGGKSSAAAGDLQQCSASRPATGRSTLPSSRHRLNKITLGPGSFAAGDGDQRIRP